MTGSSGLEIAPGSQVALCCFCGLATSDGVDGDGIRMSIARGGPEARMVVWAHIEHLSSRMTPEFAGYLDDALEAP